MCSDSSSSKSFSDLVQNTLSEDRTGWAVIAPASGEMMTGSRGGSPHGSAVGLNDGMTNGTGVGVLMVVVGGRI